MKQRGRYLAPARGPQAIRLSPDAVSAIAVTATGPSHDTSAEM